GGRVEGGTHTKTIDGRLASLEIADRILIQAAARKNVDVPEAPVIQDSPHTPRVFREITAVEAQRSNMDATHRELGCQAHDFLGSRFGVIRIDEQRDISRVRCCEMLEGDLLALVCLHKGMRHGAEAWDAEKRSREHVGCASEPGKVTGPGRKETGFRSV